MAADCFGIGVLLDDLIDVENQGHPTVAQYRCASHELHLAVIRFKALEHHLVLPQQFIHVQRDGAVFRLDHHQHRLRAGLLTV